MADLAKLGKLPAYMTEVQQDDDLDVAISGGMPKLSIRAGKWRVQEGDEETVLKEPTIRVAIIAARKPFSGALYEAWTGERKDPICFSLDKITPNPGVPQPQAESCALCASNAFGSGTGNSKACPDHKRVVVVPVMQQGDDPADLAEWMGSVTPFSLNIPAGSLKKYNAHTKKIKAHGLAVRTTVVEMSFDDAAEYPKINFEFAGVLTKGAIDKVEELRADERVLKSVSHEPIDLSREE
jgi:hypothetical protein